LDKNGKPFANQPKVATTAKDEPNDELDDSFIRHLNGFIRSVKKPENLIDFNYN
jgi:hypothetical protein